MSNKNFYNNLQKNIDNIKNEGLYKQERIIKSSQQAIIDLEDGQKVINLCANNYLGLSNRKDLIDNAISSLEQYGFGMSSVRFICGTQSIHKKLEQTISSFLGKEDAILYSSCFDANTGLFETILTPEDAIISDALNHASIIDGIRLCKAQRFIYANNDMQQLEEKLKAAEHCRYKLIATDGAFSMDGSLANLPKICDLAKKYNALVMVDDSHSIGVLGKNGHGTAEYFNVEQDIDILTGTFGKALGGASGGYTTGKTELIDYLRQRSRPYLFSNSLAPVVANVSTYVINKLSSDNKLLQKLQNNTQYFRQNLQKLGFKILGEAHPIIPVMLYDAKLAIIMANKLLAENIYVIGFSFPVVPMNQARIRTQMSAMFDREHLDLALNAFEKIGKELEII